MFRFCLIYGSILLVAALIENEETAAPKKYYGPAKEIPGKNEKFILNDGKNRLTGEFGDQYGSPMLEIHSTKSVLTDGTPAMDLSCSTGSAEKRIHNFVWWRKGPQQQTFKSLAAMSSTGVIMWPEQGSDTGWNKYQQMKDNNLVEGEVRSVTSASLTLHIPLEPCEDEGLFKCTHMFKRTNTSKTEKDDVVFHFNRTLVCGKSTSAPNFPKHIPSVVATYLESVKVNYADLAVTEMVVIIGLVIGLLVTIICCVILRKKASNKKEGKDKKSETSLPTRKVSSKSRAGMTGSARNLSSRRHLSPQRQPSYSSTGPTYNSPSQRNLHHSMTRMGGPPPPPPPMGGPPPPVGGPLLPRTGPGNASMAPRQALFASINARRVSSSNM